MKAAWACLECLLTGIMQGLLSGLIKPVELTDADSALRHSACSPEEDLQSEPEPLQHDSHIASAGNPGATQTRQREGN